MDENWTGLDRIQIVPHNGRLANAKIFATLAYRALLQRPVSRVRVIIVRERRIVGAVYGGSNRVRGGPRAQVEAHIHYSLKSVYLTGNVVRSTVSICVRRLPGQYLVFRLCVSFATVWAAATAAGIQPMFADVPERRIGDVRRRGISADSRADRRRARIHHRPAHYPNPARR